MRSRRSAERRRAALQEVVARLEALSPLATLARGYAVARDASGTVLRSVGQFPPGLAFRLRVRDGEIAARAGVSGWPRQESEKEVAVLEESLRGLGISAVPTFIFGRKLGVSGAHPPDALVAAMREAAS